MVLKMHGPLRKYGSAPQLHNNNPFPNEKDMELQQVRQAGFA